MEAIRTCHKCGRQYTGYHCQNPSCRKSRKAHSAASSRSRARVGGSRKTRRYAAGGLSWSSAASVGPIHADACPKPLDEEKEKASGNYLAEETDYYAHPD